MFLNLINLDFVLFSSVSVSIAKSMLLIVSTLFSVIKSLDNTKAETDDIPEAAVDVIPVSEKFFNPVVWTNLLTGSTISVYAIGLWTVYDRFW